MRRRGANPARLVGKLREGDCFFSSIAVRAVPARRVARWKPASLPSEAVPATVVHLVSNSNRAEYMALPTASSEQDRKAAIDR